jgi:hypothetical protein
VASEVIGDHTADATHPIAQPGLMPPGPEIGRCGQSD